MSGFDLTAGPGDRDLKRQLDRVWSDKPGLWGWLSTVDHKKVGRRYIVTTFVFFVLGGIAALIMRAQLSGPENGVVGPQRYNELFTLHGSTMMFLFAVPVMQAVAIYIIPLMCGTKCASFPRLNAYGYWVYLFGGVFLYAAWLLNVGPDIGWFGYVPLSGPEYSPGHRADVWAQMVTFTEVASIAGAVVTIGTIFKQKAAGMSLARMPLFLWAMLVESFMILFAMPAVMVATSGLISDRLMATHFYNPAEGGDPVLFQHLFWFFGHPEVYIIFVPALGFVSTIVETWARRPIFAYPAMVMALIANGFLAFGLWVHHMFATGLPRLGNSFYTAASMTIAIPAGVQIFCWIATMFEGRPKFSTPMLYVCGFIVVFVLGGLTGVMLASVPFDLQAHDTYFVVAHFHYVLIGGAVFPLLGALHHWFPKITGRRMSETAGKWGFWLVFVGFNLTFFPMHILGLMGMPRRVFTYTSEMGWNDLNLLASGGAFLLATGVSVFALNGLISIWSGKPADGNPWNASTLEWATTSPPPSYNFARTPVVYSRTPLWDEPDEGLRALDGLRTDRHEVLTTSVIEGAPELRHPQPPPTIWPLLAAIATSVLFIWSILSEWGLVYGSIPLTLTLIGWFWPVKAMETEGGETGHRRGQEAVA